MSVLGATASGLYWMFRNLERADSATRVIEATLRVSFTDAQLGRMEWDSIISAAGLQQVWADAAQQPTAEASIIDLSCFLLAGENNPSNVLTMISSAHSHARRVRTALSRETAEAMNSTASRAGELIRATQDLSDLPETLAMLRRLLAQVQGAHGVTAMRNENFSFGRLGTFVERADSTARILSTKTVALSSEPSAAPRLENLNFETLLRSVAAQRAFRWVESGVMTGPAIAEFLVRSRRTPRSLAYSFQKIVENLGHLNNDYGTVMPSAALAESLLNRCTDRHADQLIADGLYAFLSDLIQDTATLGIQISTDYRFER